MGCRILTVMLYTIALATPSESNREKITFDTKVIGGKVYVGNTRLVTSHDGDVTPILKEVDNKIVIYLDKFDLIDVENGPIHVLNNEGRNQTINGVKITFRTLYVTDYMVVLSVASDSQYMMNRIVNSL